MLFSAGLRLGRLAWQQRQPAQAVVEMLRALHRNDVEIFSIRIAWIWCYIIIWPWTVQVCFQGRDLAVM